MENKDKSNQKNLSKFSGHAQKFGILIKKASLGVRSPCTEAMIDIKYTYTYQIQFDKLNIYPKHKFSSTLQFLRLLQILRIVA